MITVQLVNGALQERKTGDGDLGTQYKKYKIRVSEEGRRALHREVDKVSGVSASHYGELVDIQDKDLHAFRALTTCNEYAIIAHWSLHSEDDSFKCYNFFYVPSPYKRTIRKDADVELNQVLYSSPHTKDVYLFF